MEEASDQEMESGNQPLEEPGEKTDPNRGGELVYCECGAKFLSKSSLQKHRNVHTKKKTLSCHHCEFGFGQYKGLYAHLRVKHIECWSCRTQFESRDLLDRHIKDEHSKFIYVCSQCGEIFWAGYDLQRHYKEHTKKEQYVCHHCADRQSFSRNSNFHQHLRKVHMECWRCRRRFQSPDLLNRHICIKDEQSKRSYLCHCGDRFGYFNLWAHLREKHRECQICGRQFQSMDILDRHVKDVHLTAGSSGKRRPRLTVTPLVVSDTEASKKTSLGNQSNVEPGASCSVSSKISCSSNDELEAHEKTDPDRGKLVVCPQRARNQPDASSSASLKVCSSNDEFRAHETTHREPMEYDLSTRSAEAFSKFFTTKTELHTLTCSDEGYSRCEFCSILFYQSPDSSYQVKIVFNQILYECNECLNSYMHLTSLALHMEKDHKNSFLENMSNVIPLNRWFSMQRRDIISTEHDEESSSKESLQLAETQTASNTAVNEKEAKKLSGTEESFPLISLVPVYDMEVEEGESSTSRVSTPHGADGSQEENLADELDDGDYEIEIDDSIVDFNYKWRSL